MSQRARQQRQADQRRRAAFKQAGVIAVVVLIGIGIAVVAVARWPSGASGVRVSMTEFAFSPDPIVLPRGDGARLEVVNDGAIPHDLLITELGKGTPDLAPGERQVIDLSDQPAGTYQVVCDITGHTEAGMVTELTLE